MRLPFHLANYVLVRSPSSGPSASALPAQPRAEAAARERGSGRARRRRGTGAAGQAARRTGTPLLARDAALAAAPRSARRRLENPGLEVRSALLAPENLPFCAYCPIPTHQMAREGIAGIRLLTQTLPELESVGRETILGRGRPGGVPSLPGAPEGFLEEVTFTIEAEEEEVTKVA